MPSAQLTRLLLVPDTCSLAIGPSQQYDGGQELYLDQTSCQPGTIIAYYEGTELSDEEKDASSSRYIFTIPTGPDTVIHIDANDPNSCYARYADDSLYDGTENAHWVVIGTGSDTRLALVATEEILRGMPIRACYGWEYWFQPDLFPKDLMKKAFRGYINYIKDDDDAQKAWDFAEHVALQDLLLTAWEGVRRDLLPSPDDMVTELVDTPHSNNPTPNPTETFPVYDPTSDPTYTLPVLVAHTVSSQRLQGLGVSCATNSTVTATKCGQDGEMAPGTEVTFEDRPASVPGPLTKKMKTCASTDIRAHFVAVPTQGNAKSKRPRDAQVHNQGEPSLKKQKAREAIAGLLCNCPWQPEVKQRKRKRTQLDEGAASAMEGDASLTSPTLLHDMSDTVLPPLYLNKVPNDVLTRAPPLGPRLNLITVNVSGSTATTEPTHVIPDHTYFPASLALPVVPVHVVSLSSLPLGNTTVSHPLNER
jgi:hypothetical protein